MTTVHAGENGPITEPTKPTNDSEKGATRQPQGCGKMCAYVVAVTLICCGIVVVVIGPLKNSLIPDALDKACSMQADDLQKCYGTGNQAPQRRHLLQGTLDVVPLKNSCLTSVKQALQCSCPTANNVDCDCSNTTVGQVLFLFKLVMIVLGAAGCGLAFMVAVLALAAARRSAKKLCVSFLCTYSACSALLTLVYGAIGAALILVAVLLTSIKSDFIPAMWSDCETYMAKAAVEPNNVAASRCQNTATCDLVNDIRRNIRIIGLGMGIPFFVAGFCMWVGCWACCCCTRHFIDAGDEPTPAASGGEPKPPPNPVEVTGTTAIEDPKNSGVVRDTPPSLGSEGLEQKLLVPVVSKAAEVEATTVTATVTRPATAVVITPDGKRFLRSNVPRTVSIMRGVDDEPIGINIVHGTCDSTSVNLFIITEVFPNSPAHGADISPPELVIKISDKSTTGMSHADFKSMMRGASKTPLVIELEHLLEAPPNSLSLGDAVANLENTNPSAPHEFKKGPEVQKNPEVIKDREGPVGDPQDGNPLDRFINLFGCDLSQRKT